MVYLSMSVAAAAIAAFYLPFALKSAFRKPKAVPFPPGPKPLPVVGNLFDLPKERVHETFTSLRKQYGDLIFLNVLGSPMLIVNSLGIARELLNKRGAKYSERPFLPMATDLCGYVRVLPLMPSENPRFRSIRKALHSFIGTRASVHKFSGVQEEETARLLLRILRDPSSASLESHLRKLAGGIILKLAYGYTILEDDDPFVKQADLVLSSFSKATAPGSFIVDVLPVLKHVPEWLPGTGFIRFANTCKADLAHMFDAPFRWARDHKNQAARYPNFFSMNDKSTLSEEEEEVLKDAAGALYGGGADTTVSVFYCLFLLLARHPDVQAKAQAELDRVVGVGRLPKMTDRLRLPYVDAISKELLRWNVVAPTGFPHMLAEDDIYNGYFIPKGTIVLANIYCMLLDPETYKNPSQFVPERFLPVDGEPAEQDPHDIVFGFGRRICPGLHIADSSTFLFCATILYALNISKAVENGVVIEPIYETKGANLTHPKTFQVSITERSETIAALAQSAIGL